MSDIDAFWEYTNPALSESRFRHAFESATGDTRLELLTQIARTYSLRRRFDDAHALLDEIEGKLARAGDRPFIRYHLERGRTHNSSGERGLARDHFQAAYERATAVNQPGLAVDAAHMLAITHAGTPEAVPWTERALARARQTDDPKARALIPALLNNGAWDLHDMGRYDEALPWFEAALDEWTAREKPKQIQIARWSLARCLRSLGRHAEALAIQRALEAEHAAAGTSDGYVFEEIAENLTAQNDHAGARPYFQRAHEALSQDTWLAQNEPDRLARLHRLANEPPPT